MTPLSSDHLVEQFWHSWRNGLGASAVWHLAVFFARFPCKRQEPSHVTHVDVTHNNMHFIKRIDSQRDIDTIIAFVSQRRSGWVQPLAGVPVARLYVCFYDGDKIAGDFGVGPGFFETDLAGDQFRSKDAAKSETETFLALIGMKNVHWMAP